MLTNIITDKLQIRYPIVQAPMAGGVTTSELVATVSNNGALGMIGAGYMRPDTLKEQIQDIKHLTTNPFGVNVFVPTKYMISTEKVESALKVLQPIYDKLKVKETSSELPNFEQDVKTYHEVIEVIIEENIPVCSFTFGLPTPEIVSELKQNNIIVIGTATTVKEAMGIEQLGMDIVVVQGSEAGGHRGDFTHEGDNSLIGLMSLIPQVVDHVNIPVIAAGGIMDGRGFMAATCLGAKAVQMGTAFLTCVESGAHPVHKDSILNATEDETILTSSFSGKSARGIKNHFIRQMDGKEALLPDFPVQNTLTKPIRKTASTENNHEFMSLWSGQSPRLAKSQTVKTLIDNIVHEVQKIKKSI